MPPPFRDSGGMPNHEAESNTCSPSTSFVWKRVKLKRSPPENAAGPLAVPATSLVRHRDRAQPLYLWLRHSGGAESWWLLASRGKEWRFPGHAQLEDVGAALNGEVPHRQRDLVLLEAAGHYVWSARAKEVQR